MAHRPTVLAAGTLTWRRHDGHTELLVIHRARYDDWTFPKGKLDPGEQLPQTAVRETEEETGVRVRLGAPLATHEYPVRGSTKRVRYWLARPTGGQDVEAYVPNDEVDAVDWVRVRDAAGLLTYARDRDVLETFRGLRERGRQRTRSLLLLRHAAARSRAHWSGPDAERTLTRAGERQATTLVATLAAYGVRRIVSSDTERCRATVLPYADRIDADVVLESRLSEDGARPKRVRHATYDLLDTRAPVVGVTHRPVLPHVFDALGLNGVEPLDPADLLVVHHYDGDIVATERYSH